MKGRADVGGSNNLGEREQIKWDSNFPVIKYKYDQQKIPSKDDCTLF